MKIVFLDQDNFQKQQEHFDYRSLDVLGESIYYGNTDEDLIYERAKDADILIVLKTQLSSTTISALKNTKLICKVGTGYDNIDVKCASQYGISVTNFPGYASEIVAQWTISLLFSLAGNILLYDKAVRNNNWQASQFIYPITEVRHKTLGIIGYGAIGKKVAELALALGMKVLVNTKHPTEDTKVIFVERDYLYQHSDFLSLHCSLNDKTRNIINADVFKVLKPSCFLINTARAALINKQDLINAIKDKTIAGAAIDGFWQEPPEDNDPLFFLDNVIITPHVGWASQETRQRLLNDIAKRIKEFIEGKVIHTVC